MASKKIKGITIQFGADMSALDKALKDVDSTSASLNKELGQVNKLLKFDPGNTQLLAQKQKILAESVENSGKKLDALKQAQGEVEKMFKSGDIGEGEYREFQRTLMETEQSLKSYKTQAEKINTEQKKLKDSTKQLETFFNATGKSLDDFQDILGTKLTNAIKNGTANSDDLTVALNKIGKQALGAEVDLSEMRTTLNKIDDGASLEEINTDLKKMKNNSDESEESLKKLGSGITAGNLMQAAEIISDAGQKIKEFGDNAKEAFKEVDAGSDAIITATGASGKFADGLYSVYKNIVSGFPTDNLENVGKTIGEINTQFGFTDEKLQSASELMLKFAEITGSDVVASTQNAKQAISVFGLTGDDLESVLDGVAKIAQDTGVSVDTLFNNVINGAPNLKELGLTFQQSTELLGNFEQAGVDSGSALSSLSKAAVNYAAEGKTLSEGLAETQDKILGAKDQTEALNVAAEIFGTKGAVRMVDAIQRGTLNLSELGDTAESSQGTVTRTFEDTLDAIDKETVASNNVKLAMADFGNAISEAVTPILEALIPIIKKVADWFSGLSGTSKTIIVVIGGFAMAVATLLPILAVVAGAITAAGGAMAFLSGTFLPVIGVIAGVIAAIIAVVTVIKNWGAITDWLKEKWSVFKEWIGDVWESIVTAAYEIWDGIKNYFSRLWEGITDKALEMWNGLKDYITGIWTGIVDDAKKTWGSIKDFFTSLWENIVNTVKDVWNGIADFFGAIWDKIYSIIEIPLKLIKGIIEGVMYAIYAINVTTWEVIKAALKGAWNWISTTALEVFTKIEEFFKTIWKGITSAVTAAWDGIKRELSIAWDWISTTASAVFTPIAEFFYSIWDWIKNTVISVWKVIKEALKGAWDWISDTATDVFTSVSNFFSDTWNDIKETVYSIWNSIKDTLGSIWDGIKTKATDVFSTIWKYIKDGFNALKDSLGRIVKGIANGIISPIGKAINGVINGVNWILDKVGSDKQFALWEVPHFAKGAGGIKKDTIGVVNDQKGSVYKEMIVPPNGKPFVPAGRDVVLPLKKGTKIMPARQTKSFLESLPHFAGGIGQFFGGIWEGIKDFTGNVWDYMTHPSKILQIAIDKFTDLAGIVEPWLSVATGAVSSVFDGVVDFIKGIFDTQSNVNYSPSAGVEQWRELAKKALQMEGQYSDANLERLLYQMQTESGGNPNAINNWDINAINGTPSKGLLQVIDPTFRAYARPGFDQNIWDPLSNMLASIRYAVSRYGSLGAAYKGVGYEEGIGNIDLSTIIPRIPALDVKWFQDGGILTKPALFNFGNGRVGGAGEAGAEAIAPVKKLKEYVQDAVLEILGDKDINITTNISNILDGKIVAKQTVRYTKPLIEDMEKFQNYLKGVRT